MARLQPAHAKLTRSLRVVGRRTDGYHLIEAEMVTVDLADSLELSPITRAVGRDAAASEAESELEILEDGGDVGGAAGPDNLVSRALRLLRRQARVRLVKRIPSGAGLGGGSADAAAVVRWAAGLVGATPQADIDRALELAAGLGGDVPFCVVGGRALVRGIGEVVEPMAFEDRRFALVIPPLMVSTADVYRVWDELGSPRSDGPNDLEPAAMAVAPDLVRWRDALGERFGRSPTLAGSGSSWFVELRDAEAVRDGERLRAGTTNVALRLVRTTPAQVTHAAIRPRRRP